jgi:hypothetical protein
MRKNSGSISPKKNEDEILKELQCVSYELRKVAENPEYKYFSNERFREKIEYIVREEFYFLIEDDTNGSEKNKQKESSTVSKFYNNLIRG